MCCDHFVVGNTVVIAAVVETQKNSKLKSTLKLDFKFDSMTVVLYSPNVNELTQVRTLQHEPTHTVSRAQVIIK